jgi:hydrogenase-4 component F
MRAKRLGIFNAISYAAVLFGSIILLWKTLPEGQGALRFGFIYIDSLSAFFILITSVIAFAGALYSIGYIEKDIRNGTISEKKAKIYYVLFNLFCLSMFLVPAVNNLGMLWVAVEMTTLISAFLVGFYNNKSSVEAAWKYIIICSVGIVFALLGTILFSYAFSASTGIKSLNWSDMVANTGMMDKNMIKLAFVFILVGYGTKAGLAPMHTWLPDAHSQAVAPSSALLSGVLLKTAIYAILRFGIIVIKNVGFQYFGNLMLLLGLISLVIASGFILVQKDLKRLLAYSSIEHIGIISIGFGLGSPLAAAGALLHIFNHAAAKAFMFFGAGNIIGAYQKHNMNSIRGVISALPFTGIMVLLGVFAITGIPPFSVFFSEIIIIIAAFIKGSYLTAGMLLIFLAIIFGAFIYHFGEMLFGNPPKDMIVRGEPLCGKLAFLFLFSQMCVFGIVILLFRKDLIWFAQRLFQV